MPGVDAEVGASPPKDARFGLEVDLLLQALQRHYGQDFRQYARGSMERRVRHAVARLNCRNVSHLQERLLHEPQLLPALLDIFTVQVSEMFRDPTYFAALRGAVLPCLHDLDTIKVWVAGCSAGEELWSLLILFEEAQLLERTLFYATDINPSALRRAENGIYPLDKIAQYSTSYLAAGGTRSLSDYYIADYGHAIFDRSLKRRVLFADHSLASDDVFSEVHLISCRNVLIYFDRPLQDRVLGVFHRALADEGFLGLGSRESLRFSAHADRFSPFAERERIYRKCR